jgi:hypothetical protein
MAVSESGLVYSFTTKHFLPLLTTQSSKDYIRACLNAPLPSPVNPSLVCSFPNTEVGWLSISGGPFESSSKDDDPKDNNDFSHDGRTSLDDKRSRSSTAHAEPGGSGGLSSNTRGTASPHSAIPSGGSPPQHPGSSSQIVLGSPTSSLSSRTTLK